MTLFEAALSWTYHLAFAITVTRRWLEQSRWSLDLADHHVFLEPLGLVMAGAGEQVANRAAVNKKIARCMGESTFSLRSPSIGTTPRRGE